MRLLKFFFLLLPLLGWSIKLQPNHRYICYVAKVLDGDTIRCRFPYPVSKEVKTYPVRLIGIDTPETGTKKKNTGKQAREMEEIAEDYYHKRVDIDRRDVVKMGLEVKSFVETLLKNIYVVVVETDAQPYDRYGRVLGYIWLPDGRMLNEEIICSGYALPLTIPPNVKYQKLFLRCFRKAVNERRGLWGELAH